MTKEVLDRRDEDLVLGSLAPQRPSMSALAKGDGQAGALQVRRRSSGFWTVAFAFLIVMAFATLPSPLYGLYRARDHLSAFTVTVVYAIFAAGTIAALLRVRSIADRVGRRGVMLGAVATMIAAATVLAAWKDLPGLLAGRLLTGASVGLAAGTAITYLIELRVREDPNASITRARNIGTSVNVGALGIGPLVAGGLAEWVGLRLTLPYLLFIALGLIGLAGLTAVPETGSPGPREAKTRHADGSPRSARIPIPAAAATSAAFSASGLFAGLSGLFLSTTLHHPSHALAGAALFLVFSAGVISQLATARLSASRVLASGTISMLIGLALLVTAVRLSAPSLALFLVGGALIGAGAGAVFKGTTGIVVEATAPENRLAMTSDLLIALFLGLSIPVIGAGVALARGATAPDTVLGFAILVALSVSASGWALLGRRPGNPKGG
jgi:predicted MFS family arabinose efflux permease